MSVPQRGASHHEAAVLAANQAFYDAFATRDADAMDALWALHAPVACIHSGWDAFRGRDEVMTSWRAILDNPRAPHIVCRGATAHVLGDLAFVVCAESIAGSELIATNVFAREDGAWRMVHHHAGPVARSRSDAGSDDGGKPPPDMLN